MIIYILNVLALIPFLDPIKLILHIHGVRHDQLDPLYIIKDLSIFSRLYLFLTIEQVHFVFIKLHLPQVCQFTKAIHYLPFRDRNDYLNIVSDVYSVILPILP